LDCFVSISLSRVSRPERLLKDGSDDKEINATN
jgi:hypothetical protein